MPLNQSIILKLSLCHILFMGEELVKYILSLVKENRSNKLNKTIQKQMIYLKNAEQLSL